VFGCDGGPGQRPRGASSGHVLEHDPEKWIPVFRKDHAPSKI
jgi:hypothetical protein